MKHAATPTTALCHYTEDAVFYRQRNLVDDLLAQDGDFVSVMMAHILARSVSPTEVRVMNAVLITLMEHGLTPSAIATRGTYMSAPENLQGAVAAGLLGVGSQFIGTMENNAALLAELVAISGADQRRARARAIAQDYRAREARLPGFGHHLHKPDDPRALKLLEIGAQAGLTGDYIQSLRILAGEIDSVYGQHITINATGSVAALLGELNIPPELMRGFAVISRAAGLVAHVAEEQTRPSGRYIWEVVDRAIPYQA
jgi:citrate synthase